MAGTGKAPKPSSKTETKPKPGFVEVVFDGRARDLDPNVLIDD